MPLVTLVITLIVVGVLLWLVNLIPMQGTIKGILNLVVVIVVVIWLLRVFNLLSYITQFHVGHWRPHPASKEWEMLGTVLIVILLVALFGSLPVWPHSRSWGYYPGGGVGLVLLIVVVLALSGQI
jgi:hypothetical protein